MYDEDRNANFSKTERQRCNLQNFISDALCHTTGRRTDLARRIVASDWGEKRKRLENNQF